MTTERTVKFDGIKVLVSDSDLRTVAQFLEPDLYTGSNGLNGRFIFGSSAIGGMERHYTSDEFPEQHNGKTDAAYRYVARLVHAAKQVEVSLPDYLGIKPASH